jgi:hypothetical protein
MRMLAPAEILSEAGGAPDVPEALVASTAALISELGFRSPVVVDARGRIVQGAARVLAAQRLGIAAIPVRSLKESGTGSLARARAAGRDPRSESLGVIGHTVWRPMVFSRHEVSWVACRAWRWSTKQADLAVFRAAKRDGAPAVIQAAAGEVALLVGRLFGSLPGWSVVPMPCGNSGTAECFGKKLARESAAALGLPFAQVFEDRLVEGGSSHPQRYARLGPLVWRDRPMGPVLLVDDLATTGLHVEQALGVLRGEGIAALAMVWISGDVK